MATETYHVINVKGIHPNNEWIKRADGLYDMKGGPTGYSLDQYELVPHSKYTKI